MDTDLVTGVLKVHLNVEEGPSDSSPCSIIHVHNADSFFSLQEDLVKLLFTSLLAFSFLGI